ncbi:MAG: type I DNA topoisomerase [Oscillospiraceae bacterium]|jgi:DNA topoisomerase-1|nr:type I DNA topoisomerase [Oscillospiraceae bacterium]
MAKKSLVILESPHKAKTVGEYLGDEYKVTSSIGHLRDLPKNTLGVDIANNFEPDYIPVRGKEDTISALKSAAAKADRVYLATDPDREGEAIAWHLKELLGLSDEQALRVTFNEITKRVVLENINHPRPIDSDLVNAQQARRILDRIVGYQLSPLLWKKIRRGLSAGRVQSVTTRLVTDREAEIRAFVPEEYWHLDALLSVLGERNVPVMFTARFYGTEQKKRELHSAEEAEEVIAAVSGAPFSIKNVKRGDKKRNPSPPFITSTLQQEASRKLGMTPRRTMSVAQSLYEGVDVKGRGSVGLITYMRTDSLRISQEALSDAARFIKQKYGEEYYPGKPSVFKTDAGAQDAHEAIRPSDLFLTPDGIKSSLTNDQYRLYKLIWSRFLASQMSPAIFDSVTVDALSAGYIFRANHTAMKFQGFMAVYVEGRDDEEEAATSPLPSLGEGDKASLENIKKEQKFTQPPPRYTEATLIGAMKESGIGRPSTYAAMVSTITDREYVLKEGKYLRPTPLGDVVTNLMKERFSDIVDVTFTARMEEELDSIERGDEDWHDVLSDFYGGFRKALEDAETALEGSRIKVPDEESDETCDLCGRNLVIKSGRFGRFLACPGYPECSFTKPITESAPGKCPVCGGRMLKRGAVSQRTKKSFTYFTCENFSVCGFRTFDAPTAQDCPECGKTMFKKSGRGFNKPFCVNDACAAFVPEDKRGYKKKTDESGGQSAAAETEAGAAAKKSPAKKNAKKSPAKKAAAKSAPRKPAAKKAPSEAKS